LLRLGDAYLAAGQDSQADSAFATLANSVRTAATPVKAWTLYQIAATYVVATRSRFSRAVAYESELDALGVGAAYERMKAHTVVATAARMRDSASLQDQELRAAMTAWHALAGDARKDAAIDGVWIYKAMADLDVRKGDGAGAVTLLNEAHQDLTTLRPYAANLIKYLMPLYTPVGQSAPSIRATQWLNVAGKGTVHPAPGRPTLLIFGFASSGNKSYLGYAVLRRLAAQYTARGLDITLVTRTEGYYRDVLISADSEMSKIGDYYMNFLNLPVTVAIWKTDIGFRPRGDGHIQINSNPNEEAYQPQDEHTPFGHPLPCYLIDKRGTIRYVGWVRPEDEAELSHLIQEVL